MSGITQSVSEPEARERAEHLRAQATTATAKAELAEALLSWSYALHRDGRTAEAVEAAEDALKTLSPVFLANPAAHKDAINAIVAQYLGISQHSGHKADLSLIKPLAVPLGRSEHLDEDEDE